TDTGDLSASCRKGDVGRVREDLPHGGPELKWAERSGGSPSEHLGSETILGSGLRLLTWLLSLVPLDLALGTPRTQN
uniref:Uncharacterized protein n=1 Tax=Rhinolophus ferrumequinum TaxID=59479 RepID=A0A671E9S4_RHIFE